MVKTILVIDYSTNWYSILKGKTLNNGEQVKIEQAEWSDISVESSSIEGAIVHIKASSNPIPFSTQKEERIITPNFILIRNFPTDLHTKDYKNSLIALMLGNVPAINSLNSIFMCMHRPLVYSELLKIEKQIEKENSMKSLSGPKLKLIPLSYYSNEPTSHSRPELISAPIFPSVVKVGNTHAGYGKFRITSNADFDDIKSILALNNDYYTLEPLIEKDYEYRIQKIGDKYRCFTRNSSSCWKGNWGNLTFTDHPVEDTHIHWADLCSNMFGGLDIFALDVIHTKEGEDFILEINDSSFGLMWEHEEEDKNHIADLLISKMNQIYC